MKLNELLKENASELFITNHAEIEAWLHEMEIENYTIRDGVVDIDGDVSIPYGDLTQIPVQFGEVTGYFNCADNKLTTLAGCPAYIGGNFWCDNNKLSSLCGSPSHIGDSFICDNNKLTSLAGCPAQIGGSFICSKNKLSSLAGCPAQIGKSFNCSHNELKSLAGCPAQIGGSFYCMDNKLTSLADLPTHIGRIFYCSGNHITSHAISLILSGCTKLEADGDWTEIINRYLGRPDDIFECQAELIENNFEEYAQL